MTTNDFRLPSIILFYFSFSKMKNKFQDYDFKDVGEFLAYLPADELEIVVFLRNLVFNCIPNCTEKLNYNVPYYKVNKNICFIWPAAIMWGHTKSYSGVRFGFTSGNLLNDEWNYLEKGNRKLTYWKDFQNIKDINADILKALLFEAVEIDLLKITK
jgi:hypothetical protein